jgi:hypothetical protein
LLQKKDKVTSLETIDWMQMQVVLPFHVSFYHCCDCEHVVLIDIRLSADIEKSVLIPTNKKLSTFYVIQHVLLPMKLAIAISNSWPASLPRPAHPGHLGTTEDKTRPASPL